MTQEDNKICGIIGVITKNQFGFNNEQTNIFRELLWLDAFRGFDSTGMFCVNNNGNIFWAKEASNPGKFLPQKEVKDVLDIAFKNGKMLVGHNRKATKGSVTDDNAHPFIEKNIILVHNGTIFNQKEMSGDKEVDSHAICHNILTEGYIKTLEKINGAYALAWYDTKKQELYLARNTERPLYLLDTFNTWIISSEASIAKFILDRNNIKVNKLYYVPTDFIIKFNLKDNNYTPEQYTQKKYTNTFNNNYPSFESLPPTDTPKHKKKVEPYKKKDTYTSRTEMKQVPGLLAKFKNYTPKEWKAPWRNITYSSKELAQQDFVDFIPVNIWLFDDKDPKTTSTGDGILTGTWLFNDNIGIRFLFDMQDLDLIDFDDIDYLSGNIKSINTDDKNLITIWLENIWPGIYNISNNEELISNEYLEYKAPRRCLKCNTTLDITKIAEMSFKAKKGDDRIFCPKCTEASKPATLRLVDKTKAINETIVKEDDNNPISAVQTH